MTRHLTLRVEPGQVLGFLGPNGAGKTTTIKTICGVVRPTSGEIRLCGYDVARQRAQAMRQFGAVREGSRSVYWAEQAPEVQKRAARQRARPLRADRRTRRRGAR